MAAGSVETPREGPALDAVALLLIREGVTPTELAARFARLQPASEQESAAALLAHLARLGLVRVVGQAGREARYALTALGEQQAATSLADQPQVAKRLEELERLRTDLLATIAHELRTPLTAVRTGVGLLLDPGVQPDAETREQLLRTIAQSAERMQRLVADVLDLTRFRAGSIQLQLRRFDGRTLTRDVAASIAPLLQVRGQHLDVTVPPAPVWAYGDHRRLEQALLNLLANAHAFSPDGAQIHLTLSTAGGDIAWSVRDYGRGIAAADRAKLFERFFVGPSDSGSRSGGTGLGLPITLAIAQAHGGGVQVDSAVGRGSTFTLRIPAQGPPHEDEQ